MNRYLLLILSLALAACDSASFSTSSGANASASSTASSSTSSNEVTLSGESGHAELAGDKIVIKDGKLFFNAKQVADLPAGAQVKYDVVGDAKKLYINGVLTPVSH